jgi:hypothetical protein
MRHYTICLLLLASFVMMAADQPAAPAKPVEKKGLLTLIIDDRLQVREAQLSLVRAHTARLEAEAAVRDAEDQLGQLIQSLQKQYACPDCELKNDLTWVPKPKVSAPKPTPAPEKAGGQTSKEKE